MRKERPMLERLEERNREVWSGHSTILEDVTHVVGGIGVGMLLYPTLARRAKSLGWAMLLVSTAMHFYADLRKPSGNAVERRRAGRDRHGEAHPSV
jgi:hypothetical protein